MKKYFHYGWIGLLLILGVLACQSTQIKPTHVIILGIDGMSPQGMMKASTPNIDRLIENGSFTLQARSVRPTSSSSNWTSMITGSGVEQHGVTSNNWERDEFSIYPAAVGAENIFPTMFSVIHNHNPSLRTAAYYHWKGIGRLIEASIINDVFHGENELATVDSFIVNLKKNTPNLNFLSLDHVDGAGHKFGHMSDGYLKSISYTDSMIGEIIQTVEELGLLDNTMFIVISDHGFIGHGHGGDSMDELLIPYVLSGKGIRKGVTITDPIYIYDMAATVLHALQIPIPRYWIGKPTLCAFEGYTCDSSIDLGAMSIPEPHIYPNPGGYNGPGGLFVDSVLVTISSSVDEIPIYYTLDGTIPDQNSMIWPKEGLLLTSSTSIKARHIDQDNRLSRWASADFRIVGKTTLPCVDVAYFEFESLQRLPDFSGMKPQKRFKQFEISPDTSQMPRKSNIAMLFTASLTVTENGRYSFFSNSDDGSMLYINDQKVVNNDGSHGLEEKSGSIVLKKGVHKLSYAYFNGGGGGWFELKWKGPGRAKSMIFPETLCP